MKEEISSPWELPSRLEDQPGQKGSFRASKNVATSLQQAEQRMTSKESWPPPYTPQPESRICWCVQGLGAGTWASEDSPGEKTVVGGM